MNLSGSHLCCHNLHFQIIYFEVVKLFNTHSIHTTPFFNIFLGFDVFLLNKGVVEIDKNTDEEECFAGEEEEIWVLKLSLPYINEFLLKVKAFFQTILLLQ